MPKMIRTRPRETSLVRKDDLVVILPTPRTHLVGIRPTLFIGELSLLKRLNYRFSDPLSHGFSCGSQPEMQFVETCLYDREE
jgi:hypothetical protein